MRLPLSASCLLLAALNTFGAHPKHKAKRNSFYAGFGLNYAIPTGELAVSDLAVHGRQGDPSLEGFKSANAFGYEGLIAWFYEFDHAHRISAIFGFEWYMRRYDLTGSYTFHLQTGDIHISQRAIRVHDFETPVGFLWRNRFGSVSAGVRVLWHGAWSDTAYDGDTFIDVAGENSDSYTWHERGYYPFLRIDHEFALSEKLHLAPYIGVERRGWKNERTNWWDLELGVGLRLL